VTAATCRDNAIRRDIIAEEFTIAGLVESIRRHYQEGLA
jgi:uroporphyrinogen-III synthase